MTEEGVLGVGNRSSSAGVVATSIVAALALCSGVARAETPRLIPDGQFESAAALGVAVDNSCFVQGLSGSACSAADPSNDDVYVAGFVVAQDEPGTTNKEYVPGPVNKFDPSGNLLSPPSPFEGPLHIFEPGALHSGVAVNPVNGNMDTLGNKANPETFQSEAEIGTYDPATGALLPGGSFPVPPSGNYRFLIPWTVVGISTDSAGNVYVPQPRKEEPAGSSTFVANDEVHEYSPTGTLLNTFKGGSGAGALKEPTGVSVDPAGNVWVADAGNERIVELSPAGVFVREIASEGVQSLAVDAHGDVFAIVKNSTDFCGKLVAPCPHLIEYGPTGAQIADLGAGTIGAEAERQQAFGGHLPDMVAVNDATDRVYVTEGVQEPGKSLHSRVFIYRPPVAPKLESELTAEAGETEAKLGAVVNPGGVSASYRFEYGTTTSYGHTAPFPEGDTGGGFRARTVWADASGLAPGTTYHYRVVVTGELGEPLVGEDQTFATTTAAQAACRNDQFRTGFSAGLPDCRAYELVTPSNKSSAQPDPFEEDLEQSLLFDLAAGDGGRMAFISRDMYPGSPSGGYSYVATRGSGGWSSENVTPPQNYYGARFCPLATRMSAYSADLSKGVLQLDGGSKCGGPEPELVPGEPKGVNNLYLRDNTTGSYQLVNMPPPGVTGASATLLAESADLDHVLFSEQAQLTPDAPPGVANVYEWDGGAVHVLRTVLPNGTPVAGELASPAISRDGSRIFFTYAGGLYAQSAGSTVQLDGSQTGGSSGGGGLVSVTADGSQVFFTDATKLTDDSTAEVGKPDIYRYDFAAPGGERLTDLTVDPGEPANVQSVLGVGEDGSYIYFEADGVLPGSVANANGETAQAGQPNLYVWHARRSTFIATHVLVSPEFGDRTQMSATGAFLGIATRKRLTSHDNTDANTGEPDSEIYLYGAAANSLGCASCNPSGERPTAPTGWEKRSPRTVSDNGQVFFDSEEALLPADTNGQEDVYQFEPGGVGNCSEPVGCVSLLSTGTSSRRADFIEASPSGSDVFLREYQKLVPQDKQEEARVIYDVRVEGGFSEPAAPPACTTADACRTAPASTPSIFGAPASQTFSGAGNLLAPAPAINPPAKPKPKPKKCRKGYVKKKSKCVKAKKSKKAKKARKSNRKGSK
jgi:hypothetical protein